MKLIRFGEQGKEKPGIILNDKKYDVSPFVKDYNEEFFNLDGLSDLEKIVKEGTGNLREIPAASRLGQGSTG